MLVILFWDLPVTTVEKMYNLGRSFQWNCPVRVRILLQICLILTDRNSCPGFNLILLYLKGWDFLWRYNLGWKYWDRGNFCWETYKPEIQICIDSSSSQDHTSLQRPTAVSPRLQWPCLQKLSLDHLYQLNAALGVWGLLCRNLSLPTAL